MRSELFGDYYVKPCASAIRDAEHLFPHYGDYQEARRHALKLAFWPGQNSATQVVDIDWEWIQALRGDDIGELRIQTAIGGCRNLRVVFWIPKAQLPDDPKPRIWTIAVVEKKSNNWSAPELKAFSARIKMLKKRHY